MSVKVPDPEFEGQTKTRLGNPEVKAATQRLVTETLEEFLRVNPATLKVIVEKASLAQKAADAAKRAREMVRRKTVLTRSTLPGKLADCTSTSADTEIFIVEGDSAGGSAKQVRTPPPASAHVTRRSVLSRSTFDTARCVQARDRVFQAILPLRGKILNVEKADDAGIFKNKELSDLIVALGLRVRGEMGPRGAAASGSDDETPSELDKLRYGKIILLTDADVDGAHIRTLLLTFLYRYQPSLFHHGHVYVGLPPLYKVEGARGKVAYCYDDAERDAAIKALKGARHTIQRFKGLGEMMPQQLWETTMDPAQRKLIQLTLEDVLETEQVRAVRLCRLRSRVACTECVAAHSGSGRAGDQEPHGRGSEQAKSVHRRVRWQRDREP